MDAAYLYQAGVVDTVTTADGLMDAAWELARDIASKSPVAVRAAKWSANEIEKILDYEQANRAIQSRVTLALAATEDHKESIRAFAESGPPFQGPVASRRSASSGCGLPVRTTEESTRESSPGAEKKAA